GVAGGEVVPVAALARKFSARALRVTGAATAVRPVRLTLVVFALPLLSMLSVAVGLTMKPAEFIAVPAATSTNEPAWTTVFAVYVLAESKFKVPAPTLVRSPAPLTMPGRLSVTPELTPIDAPGFSTMLPCQVAFAGA